MPNELKTMTDTKETSPTIGLALGGGGVRGFAHVGVLKVLEQEKIPINLLAGTSMGGLIAATYASGMSAADLEREVLHLSNPRQLIHLLDPARLRRGLIKSDSLLRYMSERMGNPTFDELPYPLALVAVELNSGEKRVMREGNVLEAVRATTAFPGVFTPVEKGQEMLIDGGLVDNLPADVARDMGAERVIAVDVTDNVQALEVMIQRMLRTPLIPEGITETLTIIARSYTLLIEDANRRCLESGRPDIVIRPQISDKVTVFTGFGRAAEVIAAGEEAARAALPILRRLSAAGPSEE
jgi:NTE family protein